jgi:drug/metabolite transporter (DMT)-like permease
MLAIGLALAAAASWGLSAVLARSGLRELPIALGTFISLCSGLVLTLILTLVLQLDDLRQVSLSALLLFGLIGLLNFPLGRFFNYMAMSRLGVGRSTPILASAPLFAVVIAVIFTGEDLRAATAVGTAMILAGLYITLQEPGRP